MPEKPEHKDGEMGLGEYMRAVAGAILALVITSFCVWCGVGSIAENVHGSGILMHKGRYVALTSPGEGLVVSFDVKIGDSLAHLSVATGADGWELIAYFSAAEARKLAKGMTAVVTPSTVKAEREGGIRGQVMMVGTDFETPESIQCDFRNDAFTQWIMSRTDGMPVKVRMLLESDPASASGFCWTGGGGPDIRIADGTVAAVVATVRRHRPAFLAFAKVIRYATGDGEMEEGILGN